MKKYVLMLFCFWGILFAELQVDSLELIMKDTNIQFDSQVYSANNDIDAKRVEPKSASLSAESALTREDIFFSAIDLPNFVLFLLPILLFALLLIFFILFLLNFLNKKRTENKWLEEKRKNKELLYHLLPNILIDNLKNNISYEDNTLTHHHKNSVIFLADFTNFSYHTNNLKDEEVFKLLFRKFSQLDEIIQEKNGERIKVIGDAYLAISTAGKKDNYAQMMFEAAVKVIKDVSLTDKKLQLKIALHLGDIVCGIGLSDKYLYDVFGRALNQVFRLNSIGNANQIIVSEKLFSILDLDYYHYERDSKMFKDGYEMNFYRIFVS